MTSHRRRRQRIIRVDQAGEYGAKQIYAGQLAVLGHTDSGEAIAEMAEQEQAHLDAFDELMRTERVRPTALQPVWRVAGYALGAGTALLGRRAAMACTVAVEEVIDAHYAGQIDSLDPERDANLRQTLEAFRRDEDAHRRSALEHDAESAPGYRVLTRGIRRATRLAIWLSERI